MTEDDGLDEWMDGWMDGEGAVGRIGIPSRSLVSVVEGRAHQVGFFARYPNQISHRTAL